MAEFILFMHGDGPPSDPAEWERYLNRLRASGAFEGGSEIGEGACYRKEGAPAAVTEQIGGYIKVVAADLAEARQWLEGNPVYEAGGTVEIRELPTT